jgi:hypothetical protein
MHGLSTSRIFVAVATATAAAVAGWSAAPAALADDAHHAVALNQQFAGVFTFHACPAGSAPGDFCLTDALTGELPGAGAVTGTFEVDIHKGSVGADNCGPIDKHGAFTTADGSKIHVDASGVICGGIASYRYAIDGGAGAYQHAGGHGVWLIPPADGYTSTGGNGPEILFGTFSLS